MKYLNCWRHGANFARGLSPDDVFGPAEDADINKLQAFLAPRYGATQRQQADLQDPALVSKAVAKDK